MPSIEWNKVEEQDFSPIAEGKYTAKITNVRDTQKDSDELLVTSKGDEMWSVTFDIIGPKYAGRKIFTNLIFNEGGYGNIKKLYSTIFGTKLPKKCTPNDIIDEVIDIDVTITEYKGKKQNSIPYAGFSKASMEAEEAEEVEFE